jgi:hypothetical protein
MKGHSSCSYGDSPQLWLQSIKPTNNPSTRHILQIISTVTWHILQWHVNTFYFLLYGPMMANSIAETCSSWYSSQYMLRWRINGWLYSLVLEFLEDTGSESFRKCTNQHGVISQKTWLFIPAFVIQTYRLNKNYNFLSVLKRIALHNSLQVYWI